MSEQYILAIDEGTTSTREIIFNYAGQQVASVAREFTQYFPKPGWVEHQAEEIWNAVQITTSTALINSAIRPDQLAVIGITNQRETTVVRDKETGRPIYPAIVWQSWQTSDIGRGPGKGGKRGAAFWHDRYLVGLEADPGARST